MVGLNYHELKRKDRTIHYGATERISLFMVLLNTKLYVLGEKNMSNEEE